MMLNKSFEKEVFSPVKVEKAHRSESPKRDNKGIKLPNLGNKIPEIKNDEIS